MKALVLKDLEHGLEYVEDYPRPTSKPGWTVVDVRCTAINRRDIWITKGMYAGIRLPVILGSDASGYVDGAPVVVNPGLDWGDDPRFQSRAFHILGMPTDGSFAEQVLVPTANLYPKPKHLNFQEAAALPLAGVTAWRALFTRGGLSKSDRVLITGIGGGVAHLAMKFALAAGADVYVTSSNNRHLEKALELGVTFGVNYRETEAWDKTLKAHANGFDLVIDSAGGAPYARLIKLLDFGGRIVSYGGTLGPVPSLSPQVIFWKQLNLMGSTMGSPRDFSDMLEFVSRYEIVPDIGATYPLSEGKTAFEYAANGGHRKVVITVKD